MFKKRMRPVHPGEILREDFQNPMRLSASSLAHALDVPIPTVNDILRERRGVSAAMALRLSICLGTTPEFWLNLQTAYDLRKAEQELGERIAEAVRPLLVA